MRPRGAGGGAPESRGSFSKTTIPAAAALYVVACLPFLPALRAGFVWDDIAVTSNPVVQAVDGWWRIWFTPRANVYEDHYWPLVYATFWLEHRLWGLAPAGYHLVNILIHAAAAVLAWRLLARLAVPGAWVAAAVWAVHPVRAESVAWVIERKDVLSGGLYLGAALSFLAGRRRGDRRLHGLALALYVLGMWSKSIVVSLPAALAVVIWWRVGRLSRRDWIALAPMTAAGVLLALADVFYVRTGGSDDFVLPLGERLAAAVWAVWFYAGKTLVPLNLMPIYPPPPPPMGLLAACLASAGIVAATALAWGIRRGSSSARAGVAGAAVFLLTLVPVLGLVQHSFMRFAFVADRFQYLASLGLIAAVCGGGATLLTRCSAPPLLMRGLSVVVILVLGGLCWRQTRIWGDGESLWTHALRGNPDAWEAHHQLGLFYAQTGRLDEARAAFGETLKRKPGYAEAHANLAAALAEQGGLPAAMREAARAVELKPEYAEGHAALGAILARMGREREAIPHLEKALRLKPWMDEVRENLETARGAK